MFREITDYIKNLYNNVDFISLHEPRFYGKEKEYLNDCIESTFVSSVGNYVTKFEQSISGFTGAKHGIACVNGTEALHLSLRLVGVEIDYEVLTQPLTFIATANAIMYIGAHPVFIDVDKSTLGLSPVALNSFLQEYAEVREDGKCYNNKTGRIIGACVPMHTFGHPVKIDEILNLCEKFHIPVVEDAAESLGSRFNSKHTGTFGTLGIISFNGNKIITTGGGGMIITDNDDVAKRAKHLTTQAKVPHPWEFVHDLIGYNYRLPNLNSALGVAQMEQINDFLKKKRKLAALYKEFFTHRGIEFISEPANCYSNYWLNTILMKDLTERNQFLEFTNNAGVMTRPAWTLMNRLPMFKHSYARDIPNAEWLCERIVNIPSSVIKELN
jgi:perosamine synthetase